MILLLPSLNPVPSLLLACAFPGQILLFDSLTANRFQWQCVPISCAPQQACSETCSRQPSCGPCVSRPAPAKKWPQGLHRSMDCHLISTGAEDFSRRTVPFQRPGPCLRGPQTASNPSLCIYIGARIRKVTSTFRQFVSICAWQLALGPPACPLAPLASLTPPASLICYIVLT